MYIEFQKLRIEHRELYYRYLEKIKEEVPASVYFSEIMAWDFFAESYFCEKEGYLCILIYNKKQDQVVFFQPLGEYYKESFERLIHWLYQLMLRHNRAFYS